VRVALTPEALADLKEIGRWIARDNPRRARSFVKDLTDASLRSTGSRGDSRLSLRPGSRRFESGPIMAI
jgi:plasmid stabilization system protein ParE